MAHNVFLEQAAARPGRLHVLRLDAALRQFPFRGGHHTRRRGRRAGRGRRGLGNGRRRRRSPGFRRRIGRRRFRLVREREEITHPAAVPGRIGLERFGLIRAFGDQGDHFADPGLFARALDDLRQHAAHGRGQFHRGLVGLDVDKHFVALDAVADGLAPFADLHLGDRLAGLRDFQFDSHEIVFVAAYFRTAGAPSASAMSCRCSTRWLAAEPVAGLADSARQMPRNGHLPSRPSPKRTRIYR